MRCSVDWFILYRSRSSQHGDVFFCSSVPECPQRVLCPENWPFQNTPGSNFSLWTLSDDDYELHHTGTTYVSLCKDNSYRSHINSAGLNSHSVDSQGRRPMPFREQFQLQIFHLIFLPIPLNHLENPNIPNRDSKLLKEVHKYYNNCIQKSHQINHRY